MNLIAKEVVPIKEIPPNEWIPDTWGIVNRYPIRNGVEGASMKICGGPYCTITCAEGELDRIILRGPSSHHRPKSAIPVIPMVLPKGMRAGDLFLGHCSHVTVKPNQPGIKENKSRLFLAVPTGKLSWECPSCETLSLRKPYGAEIKLSTDESSDDLASPISTQKEWMDPDSHYYPFRVRYGYPYHGILLERKEDRDYSELLHAGDRWKVRIMSQKEVLIKNPQRGVGLALNVVLTLGDFISAERNAPSEHTANLASAATNENFVYPPVLYPGDVLGAFVG